MRHSRTSRFDLRYMSKHINYHILYTYQMQVQACRIVVTSIDNTVINVLVTFQSCISRVAQTIEAVNNCKDNKEYCDANLELK